VETQELNSNCSSVRRSTVEYHKYLNIELPERLNNLSVCPI
jgi:hypothetical protein